MAIKDERAIVGRLKDRVRRFEVLAAGEPTPPLAS